MTIQLLSISVLYLVLNSPWTIVLFGSQYGLSANTTRIYTFYGLYLRTHVIFLFPLASFASSSELRDKLKNVSLMLSKRISNSCSLIMI